MTSNAGRHADRQWSSVPTELLLAELSRRDDAHTRPACGSGKKDSYDTGIHVFALFLILFVSTAGPSTPRPLHTAQPQLTDSIFPACGFPLFSQRLTKGTKRQRTVLFVCQHFGTGVLLATAFVHLLPTAFTSLTDPCLPHFFSEGYRPLAGLVAMVSALVVVALESYLTTRGAASHAHSHAWDEEDDEEEDNNANGHITAGHTHSAGQHRHARRERPSGIALDDLEATEGLVAGASPLPGSTPMLSPNNPDATRRSHDDLRRRSTSSSDDDEGRESLELELSLQELQPSQNHAPQRPKKHEPGLPALHHIPSPEEQRRMTLQCVLLEAGILFHSVFIGMALSVATGPAFVVFLIAIAFHRTFSHPNISPHYRVLTAPFLQNVSKASPSARASPPSTSRAPPPGPG
jgi:zinc transporter 1/2/3